MELVRANYDYIIEQRRFFHQNPELSQQEFNTSKHIQNELDTMGIPYVVINDLGIIATLCGEKETPVIGLRADMDALPIVEETGLPFASQNEGVMHACGHDTHMAMLLGAAKVLSENKNALNCTVKFIFQPAEEDLAGALMMLKSPEFDDIDTYMAIHNMNKIPVGKISVQPGPRMAANGTFYIKVIGSGGHGAYPEMSVDPIVAACAVVSNLQTICSREKSPLTTAVISVCTFNAGNRCNIIPAYAELTGTVRGFDQSFLDSLPERMERIIKHTCEAYRATYEFSLEPLALMVVNDPSCTTTAQKAVTKILGDDALYDAPQSTGSEDFSFFIKDKPGVLAFVGSGKPGEEMYPLHNSKADVDEECLINGAALYAQYVLEAQGSYSSPGKIKIRRP